MSKAAVKEKIEAPWFGSFTPAGAAPKPLLMPVEEKPLSIPQAISSVPNTYPAGPTFEGFLYGLMGSQLDVTSGITRAYLSDTGNTLSSLRGLHLNKTDKTSATSHGLSFDVAGTVNAEIGIDFSTNNANNLGDFILYYDPTVLANEVQQVSVGTNTAGQFKLTFNAQQTADIAFNASAATVQSALEALSTLGVGQVAVVGRNGGPWLVELKGTLGAAPQNLITLSNGTTPLSGGTGQGITRIIPGTTGADVLRWGHYLDATGVQAPKLQMGAPAGTPAAQSEFIQMIAPSGLSGLTVSYRDDAGTLNGLSFVNRSTANRRCIFNLNNLWQLGSDYQHADTENFHIVDANDAAHPIRLFLEGAPANSLLPKAGVNTSAPISSWHVAGTSDASLYNTSQPLLSAGPSTLINRTWNLTQIIDNDPTSPVQTLMWFSGTLDAASTRATPKSNSQFDKAAGIQYTGDQGSIFVAPVGSNQTILPVVNFRYSSGSSQQRLSFFAAAPVDKQTVSAAATDLATVITLANSLRTLALNYGLA